MINKTQTFARGHLFRLQLGGLCITYTKAEKENVISASELECLELIRKIKEENRAKKFSQTDITIEEISFRKW